MKADDVYKPILGTIKDRFALRVYAHNLLPSRSDEESCRQTPQDGVDTVVRVTDGQALETADWYISKHSVSWRSLLQVQSPISPTDGAVETVQPAQGAESHTRVSTIVIVVVVSVVSTLILATIAFCIYRRRMLRKFSAARERPLLHASPPLKGEPGSIPRGEYEEDSVPGYGTGDLFNSPRTNPTRRENGTIISSSPFAEGVELTDCEGKKTGT